MDSRSRFRPRRVCVMTPSGTLELSRSGSVEMAVQRRRCLPSGSVETGVRVYPARGARVLWRRQARKAERGSARGVRTGNRHRWARRAASGERVKRGQGTRHTDPVTSEEGMPEEVRIYTVRASEGRSESAQATV
jgi:hypothetical protein